MRLTKLRTTVAGTLALAVLNLVPQPASAQITQPELAKIVKKAIEEESLLFDPPRVAYREGLLEYSPGKIFYPDYAPKPARPVGFPADAQFKIEAIRKYRVKERDLAFLQPYLARMERVVAHELALIAKHKGTPQELLEQLTKQDEKANAILNEGIHAWAKQEGMIFTGESFPAAVIPTVTFQTTPAGGTVYYLNAVDYGVYKAAGVLGDVDRWNQVPGERMDMGGVYYFRAAWPGGKTKQTAKILIDKEQTISLRAD